MRESLVSNSVPQTPTVIEFVSRVREKLKVVCEKGYVSCSQEVKSLTLFSSVAKKRKTEKGKITIDKMRMVYDATKSSLNEAVFAP